ncbi:hypothetical protein NECAME_09815 [Necator americanus]|uniref:Uncharacterized protein n=1 Tax=Necator americanus TaxID=51031 RepID=W2TC85_NECAM|nr:hypothetical protein NECAME_09815 [Necator americanus]ETN79448.1 hypothetical protein NECAME_09815 [Necator americanus]
MEEKISFAELYTVLHWITCRKPHRNTRRVQVTGVAKWLNKRKMRFPGRISETDSGQLSLFDAVIWQIAYVGTLKQE